MVTKQRGFTIVEALLILVVLGLIGFIGWRLYDAQKQSEQLAANADRSTVQSTPREEEQAENTYNSDKDNYSFEYPAGWKRVDASKQRSSDGGYLYSDSFASPDYATSEEGIGHHISEGARIDVSVQSTTSVTAKEAYDSNNFLQNVVKPGNKETVVVGGYSAVRYNFEYEALRVWSTTIVKDGKLYSVNMYFANEAARQRYAGEYKSFVDSFKFN